MIVGKLMVVLGLDSKGFNSGLSSATGKTTAFAKATDKTFKAIGKAAKIGLFAVSAAFIKGSIDAAKFEKALANVSTMLDKTTLPLMKDFEKGILSLSEAYGESTDALAKGLYDILSASIPAAKALDVLEVSAQAAKAGLTDTGVAADAITTLMNSFQDATKDASFYSDILFSAVKFGKTTFAELAPVIGNVAKVMQVAGGTAEDMAGMLAIMTRNGIKTRVAVTSLRGVVSALIKPSEALTEELGGMTVKADGFRAVMDKIGSLPATDLAEMFPNIRALTGVVVAAKDLGAEVEKINDLMADGSPTIIALEKQMNTLAFIWDQFKATLKATSIAIGDELLPQIKDILKTTTAWLKENKEGFANFAKTTLKAIKDILSFMFRFKEAILGVGSAILGLMALGKVTALMTSFGIATSISMGPVAAIAVAIGLLVAAFFKVRKSLRDYREEQELLDKAAKGRLGLTEDYNDAIELQKNKIADLIEVNKTSNQYMEGTGRTSRRNMEIANQAHQEKLQQMNEELAKMEHWAKKKADQDQAVKNAREEKALADQLAFYNEQARIAASAASAEEKASLLRQLEANRKADLADAEAQAKADAEAELKRIADIQKAKEDEVASIRKALFLAAETEDEFYERQKVRLLEIGDLTEKEVIDYLTIKYPKALKSAEQATIDFYDSEDEEATDYVDNVLVPTTESFVEKWTNAVNAVKEVFTQMYSAITGVADQYFTNMFSKLKKEEANKKKITSDERKRIEKLYDDELISEEEYQKQIKIINDQELADEKTIANKRYDIELKQFNAKKALSITELIMNTAVAMSEAWKVGPVAGPILAAFIGGLGAVQVGLIASQEPPPAPSFIRGGVIDKMINSGVFSGKPGIDTNNVNLTSGEFVMPPQQTLDNIDELEAMRSGEGGKSITINPMPLTVAIEGKAVYSAVIEFMTDGSDRGEYRINPKVIGELT